MAGQHPSETHVPEISVSEAWRRLTEIAGSPAPAFVDVREAWEYQSGHASGALNLPLSQLRQRHGEVPADREVLFICEVGARSMQAAQFMRTKGVERVANVGGGTQAWRAHGLPMER